MQNFQSFQELSENAEQTTDVNNAFDRTVGGTPPVTPTAQTPNNLPGFTPEWRKSVDERLGNIERNMVTKADLKTELDARFTAFEQRIGLDARFTAFEQRIETLIKQK